MTWFCWWWFKIAAGTLTRTAFMELFPNQTLWARRMLSTDWLRLSSLDNSLWQDRVWRFSVEVLLTFWSGYYSAVSYWCILPITGHLAKATPPITCQLCRLVPKITNNALILIQPRRCCIWSLNNLEHTEKEWFKKKKKPLKRRDER